MSEGEVRAIYRFPVLGCLGEGLDRAEVTQLGIEGDRAYALLDVGTGMLLEPVGKRYRWGETVGDPRLLRLRASLSDGELVVTLPDGRELRGDRISPGVSSFLGRRVTLVEARWIMQAKSSSGKAIHLLSNRSLDALRERDPGHDFAVERFRPNVYVEFPEDSPSFLEERLIGSSVRVGEQVALRVEEPNPRCAVITLAHGPLPRDPDLLRLVTEVNRGCLGVLCSVLKGGRICVSEGIRFELSVDSG